MCVNMMWLTQPIWIISPMILSPPLSSQEYENSRIEYTKMKHFKQPILKPVMLGVSERRGVLGISEGVHVCVQRERGHKKEYGGQFETPQIPYECCEHEP